MRIQSSKVLDAQMRALGAIPQVMAFSEVYQALQTGVVDGTENPPSNLYTQKMHEVQKHVTLSDHGYLGYAVIVNKKFWDGLPADIRGQLEQAMKEATVYANQIAQKENDDALEAMKKSGKTPVLRARRRRRSAALKKALLTVHKEMESRVGKDLIDAIHKETASIRPSSSPDVPRAAGAIRPAARFVPRFRQEFKMLKFLDHLEEWLIAFLMGAATLIIFVAVVHRYAAGLPIPGVQDWLLGLNLAWAQELCIYMFVWMAKFGAAYGVRTGIHVGVDVLINRLNERTGAKFIVFGLLAGALFTGIVGTLGANFVWEIGAHHAIFKLLGLGTGDLPEGPTTPDLEMPIWLVYSAVPLGSYLMCFRFLQVLELRSDRRAAAPRPRQGRGHRGGRAAGAGRAIRQRSTATRGRPRIRGDRADAAMNTRASSSRCWSR